MPEFLAFSGNVNLSTGLAGTSSEPFTAGYIRSEARRRDES
jgi:hypothetical protein